LRNFDLAHVAESLFGRPWAVMPAKLAELVAAFQRRQAGLILPDAGEVGKARREAREQRAAAIGSKLREVGGVLVDQVGKVAILPLRGTVTQRPSLMTKYSGGTSAEAFTQAHAELLADKGVRSVVWDVDSPGGSVAGVPEAAARLLAMRGEKRTVAVSNTINGSAAYWLSSTADEIVASPSSETGSIGVFAVHEDWSAANAAEGVTPTYISAGKYKVESNPDSPLSGEALASIQQAVDDYYGLFVAGVAKARGTTEARVRNGYGEGRALTAVRAKDAGLVDRVQDLAAVLRRLGAYD
jgi:capsid assembly protease